MTKGKKEKICARCGARIDEHWEAESKDWKGQILICPTAIYLEEK